MPKILIAGVSTRAAAESAARAGFAVTAIDAFGDVDQHPSVTVLSLPNRFTARAAALAGQAVECDAVVYLSSFENHPGAIATLGHGGSLWGNSPAVVSRVRDPLLLARALHRRGLPGPEVRLKPDTTYGNGMHNGAQAGNDDRNNHNDSDAHLSDPDVVSGLSRTTRDHPDAVSGLSRTTRDHADVVSGLSRTTRDDHRVAWLVKPLASGGGQRIRPWDGRTRIPRGCYLQEFIEGPAGSVVFVAAGGRAVILGVSRQLSGEEAFGAAGYQYCGNVLTAAADPYLADDEGVVDAARRLVDAVVEEFDLVGVNGIDFITRGGVPYPVEVNPRWCASMELVERAYGLAVFPVHAAACSAGVLPEFDFLRARTGRAAVGKAVVYARHDVIAGETRRWLTNHETIRDIPPSGSRIPAGKPVCTIFADGADGLTCHDSLVQCASRVYAQIEAWRT